MKREKWQYALSFSTLWKCLCYWKHCCFNFKGFSILNGQFVLFYIGCVKQTSKCFSETTSNNFTWFQGKKFKNLYSCFVHTSELKRNVLFMFSLDVKIFSWWQLNVLLIESSKPSELSKQNFNRQNTVLIKIHLFTSLHD